MHVHQIAKPQKFSTTKISSPTVSHTGIMPYLVELLFCFCFKSPNVLHGQPVPLVQPAKHLAVEVTEETRVYLKTEREGGGEDLQPGNLQSVLHSATFMLRWVLRSLFPFPPLQLQMYFEVNVITPVKTLEYHYTSPLEYMYMYMCLPP